MKALEHLKSYHFAASLAERRRGAPDLCLSNQGNLLFPCCSTDVLCSAADGNPTVVHILSNQESFHILSSLWLRSHYSLISQIHEILINHNVECRWHKKELRTLIFLEFDIKMSWEKLVTMSHSCQYNTLQTALESTGKKLQGTAEKKKTFPFFTTFFFFFAFLLFLIKTIQWKEFWRQKQTFLWWEH